MAAYLRPRALTEALAQLGQRPYTILAGGTDFYPARVGRPVTEDVLDIGAIDALRGIEDRGDHWWLGACTTWSDIIRADLPPMFDGLVLAAREVGGIQIQNAGTLGGNICNASPAADGVPPLLSLDAAVELASADTVEIIPLADFLCGYRKTACQPHQIVTGLRVPKPAGGGARGHFLKLGARDSLVISIVIGAAMLDISGDRISRARVVVGACTPVGARLATLEDRLVGERLTSALGSLVEEDDLAALTPIDDARASAAYRKDAALIVIRRVLNTVGGRS